MLQPQNQSLKYEMLFTGIDGGTLKIPVFQRDFVWTTLQTAKLIDSIIKGFPIGTFILWKTREVLKANKSLGETMKTHMIDDLAAYGVWADDYVGFIEHRADRVVEELERRLYPDLD